MVKAAVDYEALRPFATPRQHQLLDSLKKHGTQAKAAQAEGISLRNFHASLKRLTTNASLRGFSPDHDFTHAAPEGFVPRGNSTLYDEAGNVVMQWVKTDRDKDRYEAVMREVVAAMSEDIKREKPCSRKEKTKNLKQGEELLNLYVITDYHLGLYAWGEETGADWDMSIAEGMLVAWFEQAIRTSPDASVGVLAQLGDFLHYDGMEAVTPVGHNILDADTRFEKLVRVAIRALRRVVRMLLEKHETVHIIMAEGNHDPASSVWLREWFAALYEDEPRVTVDQSPDPYYAYEWGSTALFFHHGHKRSVASVDDVLVAKYREVFGRTQRAFAHVGHKHDRQVKETNLMVVEQHRTLAAADAYASRGGWISDRGAQVVTYSKQYGEVGRVIISPEMCA